MSVFKGFKRRFARYRANMLHKKVLLKIQVGGPCDTNGCFILHLFLLGSLN